MVRRGFPRGRRCQDLVGVLGEDLAVTFPDHPKLRVQLEYPNEDWSLENEPTDPGCVMLNWPVGSPINFSGYRNRDGSWDDWMIYNTEACNGANFSPEYIHVAGWKEALKEHTILPEEDSLRVKSKGNSFLTKLVAAVLALKLLSPEGNPSITFWVILVLLTLVASALAPGIISGYVSPMWAYIVLGGTMLGSCAIGVSSLTALVIQKRASAIQREGFRDAKV